MCPFAEAVGPRHSPPPKPSVARPLAETPGELAGSQPALLFEQGPSAQACFVQQETHFGVHRLEIGLDSLFAQFFGGNRADRADYDAREAFANLLLEVHFAGDLEKMDDLDGRGENGDVDFAVDDRLDRRAQRAGILRQRPLIHGNARDVRAALGETGEEFGIGYAVFLERDAFSGDRQRIGVFVQSVKEVAPGVWFRYGKRDGHAEFLEGGDRLGAARDDRDAAKGLGELLERVDGLDDARERPRADAGEKNRDVEATLGQRAREGDRFGIRFEGNFAHRRRDSALAAISGDQLGHFARAAAFESQDAQAGEPGGLHLFCHRFSL